VAFEVKDDHSRDPTRLTLRIFMPLARGIISTLLPSNGSVSPLNTYKIHKLSNQYQVGVLLETDPLHFTIRMLDDDLSQQGCLPLQFALRNHLFHIISLQRVINSDAFERI
jgi:hypothetical protein